MKRCPQCGQAYSDAIQTCPKCKIFLNSISSNTSTGAYTPQNVAPQKVNGDFKQTTVIGNNSSFQSTVVGNNTSILNLNSNGNIVYGVLGAVLYSLAAVVVGVIILNIGYISGWVGIGMFCLAFSGYLKFGKPQSGSIIPLIVSVIVTLVMAYLTVYFYYVIALREYGMSFKLYVMIPGAKQEFNDILLQYYGMIAIAAGIYAGSIFHKKRKIKK